MADEKQPLIDSWAMKSLVTVNEARKDRGLPALTTEDGKPDPDGNLTVEAYNAKKCRDCYSPEVAMPVTPMRAERVPFRNLK